MTTGMQIAAAVGKPAPISVGGAQGAETGKFPSVLQTVRTKLGGKPAAKASAHEGIPKARRQAAAQENKPAAEEVPSRGAVGRPNSAEPAHEKTETEDGRDDAATDEPTATVARADDAVQPTALRDAVAAQGGSTAEATTAEPPANEGDAAEKQATVAPDGSDGVGTGTVIVQGLPQSTGDASKTTAEAAPKEQAVPTAKKPAEPEQAEPRVAVDRGSTVKMPELKESQETHGRLAQQEEVPEENAGDADPVDTDPEQVAVDKLPVAMTREMPAQGKGTKTAAKHDPVTPGAPEAPSATQPVNPGELFHWEELASRAATSMEQAFAKGAGPEKEGGPQPPVVNSIATVHGTAPTQRAPQSAETAAPAQDLPALDRHQALEQVVLGIRGKLDARNGQAEIRLDPPNLGSLHVSVRLENGALTAQFEAGNDLVRDLLNSNIGKLRSVLEGQGITVDKLAVRSGAEVAASPAAERFIGSPNHDGRSAGSYSQDPRQRQRPPEEPGQGAFAAVWRQATSEPIDVVA